MAIAVVATCHSNANGASRPQDKPEARGQARGQYRCVRRASRGKDVEDLVVERHQREGTRKTRRRLVEEQRGADGLNELERQQRQPFLAVMIRYAVGAEQGNAMVVFALAAEKAMRLPAHASSHAHSSGSSQQKPLGHATNLTSALYVNPRAPKNRTGHQVAPP